MPPALQPAGVARVAGEVVPRGGVELIAEEVVARDRLRLERHALPGTKSRRFAVGIVGVFDRGPGGMG